uniref:Uncharacterized protein n=1 Tax=Knipowitschia caucasica TaxID=637954 RepID=A0AAV2MQ50_KNICA
MEHKEQQSQSHFSEIHRDSERVTPPPPAFHIDLLKPGYLTFKRIRMGLTLMDLSDNEAQRSARLRAPPFTAMSRFHVRPDLWGAPFGGTYSSAGGAVLPSLRWGRGLARRGMYPSMLRDNLETGQAADAQR